MGRNIARLIGVVLCASVMSPAFSCSAAGDKVHVGKVASVNADQQTFTIIDAETGQPITFEANNKLLMQVANARRTIAVDYVMEDQSLVASNIR